MAKPFFLVDTNVLIRWSHKESPDFMTVELALKVLSGKGQIPCYTSQNLGEFWNVMTRPAERNGYGLSPAVAHLRAEEIEAAFHLLADTPRIHTEWRRLLVAHSISGTQVHDARIAASMIDHGVSRILTFNMRDFARFPGIEALDPHKMACP